MLLMLRPDKLNHPGKIMRRILVSVAALLALSPAVHAVPIVNTATCVDSGNLCATGITGLEVLGATLDVAFITGTSYDALFATEDPFFLGNDAGALAARDAIIAAFGASIYGVGGEGAGESTSRFLIPYLATATGNAGAFGVSDRDSSAWDATTYSALNSTDFSTFEPQFYTAYAVFRRSAAVAEPATLSLLGIGLLGFATVRRRRRAA